jgi:hypothetical protein
MHNAGPHRFPSMRFHVIKIPHSMQNSFYCQKELIDHNFTYKKLLETVIFQVIGSVSITFMYNSHRPNWRRIIFVGDPVKATITLATPLSSSFMVGSNESTSYSLV